LRMAETIDFDWKPDVWYRVKFQASVQDGVAVLKGKVWPREDDEPTTWVLEATDQAPNLQGSPGLFGNAKDAELYLDNISVTANE
ncbi:MAG: serine/threonine protein kinase, partial [Pirellulaceae bacterium]